MTATATKPKPSRSGSAMIIGGFVVSVILAIVRMVLFGPGRDSSASLETSAGLIVNLGLLVGFIVVMVGCIKYSGSKGYSKWVGFLLSLGVPSLIALLILPDLKSVDSNDKE
ncbi:MAG: hypothetical protein KGS72_13500 [Cyanobacteria bacterium REEB67]|nr:hypothetical protein [Cyanobacteria bacterium REEB67]